MSNSMARSAYYHHLYPFSVVYDWLWASENLAGDLGVREFAFRFDSHALSRFQNFTDEAEFRLAAKKANPAEIHFGGIYVGQKSYFYAKLCLKCFNPGKHIKRRRERPISRERVCY
jgi:DNA primase catalytic subunit